MPHKFIIKYPFLETAKNFLDLKNIQLFNVEDASLKKVTLFLLKIVFQEQKDTEKQWLEYMDLNQESIAESFATIYPLSRIFLSVLDNSSLSLQVANYYQNQLIFYLKKISLDSQEFKQVSNALLKELKFDTQENKYFLSMIDYLSLELTGSFKLQYSDLNQGNIYFSQQKVIELLGAVLKKKVLTLPVFTQEDVPKTFLNYISYIKQKVKEDIFTKINVHKPSVENFPTCFLEAYKKVMAGEKLSNNHSIILAIFLFNVGYNFQEMVEIFKHHPKFDKNISKISKYQLQKIVEKKYSVPSCEYLRSNGFCTGECKLKHPLQHFNKQKLKKK